MKKKLIRLILALVGACGLAGSLAADPPATHGMLLFGTDRIYLSHLSMFHSPHDYQVILEAELEPDPASKTPEDPKQAYLRDQRTSSAGFYTFVPRPFDLPATLHEGAVLTGDLFRGHFERGGVKIAGPMIAKIVRVVHFRKYEPGNARPARQEYLLFGPPSEMFLAHLIWAPPDFDQVLPVKAIAVQSPDSTFVDETVSLDRTPQKPITGGETLWTDISGARVELKAGEPFYFETEDLAQ